MICLLEWRDSFAALAAHDRLLAALFQSVTCRTAGFNTVDIAGLAPSTLFLMILLMAIGGCPASTAGGVKTTTFSVIVLTTWSRLRHHKHVNVCNRTLPVTVVADSFSLILAAVAILVTGVFLLLLIEDPAARGGNFVFLDYLFETVSALGTVGLSTGVTASLQPLSRVVIVALMFVGRLGPLTVAGSLTRYDPTRDWRYAEEEVIIG
jgi:trk system potassium uptake protein TrkH